MITDQFEKVVIPNPYLNRFQSRLGSADKKVQSLELCHLNHYAVNKKTEKVINRRLEKLCMYSCMKSRDHTYAEEAYENWKERNGIFLYF